MGLFDFWKKKEEPKTRPAAPRPTVEKKAPVSNPAPPQKTQPVKPKQAPVKASDTDKLVRSIQLNSSPSDTELILYCPLRKAKIYCHSVLIDKLGDLTKFIISSLYAGHTIDEISSLTQMGSVTVKEEMEYLVRGGLIDNGQRTLTDLGKQYGRLLEIFNLLSAGIEVMFNVFSDEFESVNEEKYVSTADPKFIIHGHFNPVLARNDNYANSLKIAQQQILADTPFCYEIKNSLYTTVKIEKAETQYKVACIRNFDRGSRIESDHSIKLAIPFDRISYKPRYAWLDPYRGIVAQISAINEQSSDLLTDKAKLVISTAQEESEADLITGEINTISGTFNRSRENLVELLDGCTAFVLERKPVMLTLDEENCKGLYLEEVHREQLYRVCFYPYKSMEI